MASRAALNANIHDPSIQGFDEFMNVTLTEAEEVWVKKDKQRKELGKW